MQQLLAAVAAMTASTAIASQPLSDIDMAFTPFPPIEVEAGPPPPPAVNNFLSKTLGDNMVLQRAPAQAILWGFAGVGNTVTVKMDASQSDLIGVTDAQGFWRASLPATEASDKPHKFLIQSSNGTTAKVSECT